MSEYLKKLAALEGRQKAEVKPTRARLVTAEKQVPTEKGMMKRIVEAEHQPSEELLLSYIPKTTKPIVTFSGTGVLRPGYIMTIVGPSGFGKSNVTESVVSSFLNPYVDTLGIRVDITDTRPLLWIDGERTRDDISIGFDRIKRRIRIDENKDLIESDRFKNVHCHPLITYPSRDARINELERLVIELQPSLVVLDGAADFVRDVNNSDECVDFIALLTAMANQYNFGIVSSIHPNPGGGNDYKPRGVLGSELIRTSESVLLLKRAPDDRDIRILTMDFMHGKNRGQADNMEHYFKWDIQSRMFLSCDYTPAAKPRKAEKQDEVITSILNSGLGMTYNQLAQAISSQAGNSIPTANRWIDSATKRELIFNNNGVYKLTPF